MHEMNQTEADQDVPNHKRHGESNEVVENDITSSRNVVEKNGEEDSIELIRRNAPGVRMQMSRLVGGEYQMRVKVPHKLAPLVTK
jgi:hypothetical protein